MESLLHWALVGAWLYAILRIEKVAYDLKKLELSTTPVDFTEMVYGGAGDAMRIAMEDSVLRPEVDRQGMADTRVVEPSQAETFLGDGDTCPECKEGTLVVREVEGCTCFINPPCHACVNNPLTCDQCGHQEHP